MVERISAASARRISLAAQGFGATRTTPVSTRSLTALMRRIRLLQLDSVNVFERSHYLPVFARLGRYDKALLDRLAFRPRSGYVEYLAHEAAILPLEDWPLMGWRMHEHRRRAEAHSSWAAAHPELLAWIRAELAEKGPLVSGEIEHESNRRNGPWWGWSDVKIGLETLFRWGEVATAGRTRFQRRYALAEQVIPAHLRDRHIDHADAVRELIRRSAAAHGIGTISDFADYYRVKRQPAARAIRELEDSGELIPVQVEGWMRGDRAVPAWRHRDARRARRISTASLLSPFDPVVWERGRALRMFGLHYRIEIYTPAPKRVFGYYVLPVLLDDRIVARVDLKSDRKSGRLLVQAAWWEEPRSSDAPAHRRSDAAERITSTLVEAAAWQGLDEVFVTDRGDFAPDLRRALTA